jgi:hypothetical protein
MENHSAASLRLSTASSTVFSAGEGGQKDVGFTGWRFGRWTMRGNRDVQIMFFS